MAERIRVAHLLIAGGLLLGASPAFAQDGMLFKNLLEGTFGKSTPDIDYRERAPLVVPPNSTLPPPQPSASARNAAWPKDPDVERRKEDRERRYVPADGVRDNPMLSPQEIRRGRTTTASQRPAAPARGDNDLYRDVIEPIRIGKEQAAHYNEEAEKQLTFGSEPPRRTLIEPPTGYRRPAGTAALGPGRSGPVEDTQAVGEREFVTGQKPMTGR